MSDDLSRLQAIFQEALTQPRDMWEGFVAEACAGNAALAREVHSLLRASEASKGFYHDLTRRVEAAVSPMIGARLGPWKILSQVGRGGMGTVYKAQRDDGQFSQQVALKTLRVGAADAQATARFANEQALLARLEHPQIARLIDGGFASDDTPYLVMEYVDGVPLDVWCREQGATLSERLRLFTRVCDAVSYAHRSLVVHRDLKPSNVLVTAAGHPKLLDFGIAKALDGGERGDLTEEGGALMTPRYAAPELLRGATATTLADVYSLGVLLYELLTGNAAYDPGLSLSDLVQQVCVQPLRAPSQRVANRPLARALRGDLDTIVLKATAKDPNERYASVDSLRQDITRHLANEPVTARGPSLAYRFAKFLRRNALASAFAGIATVALVAVAGISSLAAVNAKAQHARIAAERDRANEVQAFLVDVFSLATPEASGGTTVTAQELLARGAERVRVELDGQPAMQAQLERAIGQAFTSLSLYPQAQASLERAREHLTTVDQADPAVLGGTLYDLATVLERQGQYAEALSLANEVSATYASHAEPVALAQSDQLRARILHRQGDLAQARPLYERALTSARAHGATEPAFLTDAIINFASFALADGDANTAITLSEEGLGRLVKRHGDNDIRLAEPLHNLANALASVQRWDEAATEYRRALAITDQHLAPEHQTNAFLWNGLARAEQRLGDVDDARRSFERALAILRANFGETHPDIGIGLANLGRLEMDAGEAEAAERAFTEALAILDETLPGHWIGHDVRRRLGACHSLAERYAEAESLLLTAYDGLTTSLGETHKATREAREALVTLYGRWERPTLAARYAVQASP